MSRSISGSKVISLTLEALGIVTKKRTILIRWNQFFDLGFVVVVF